MRVVWIDYERDTFPDKGVGNRIDLHLSRVRNLFDACDYLHRTTSTLGVKFELVV
jgi:hypothetical protein